MMNDYPHRVALPPGVEDYIRRKYQGKAISILPLGWTLGEHAHSRAESEQSYERERGTDVFAWSLNISSFPWDARWDVDFRTTEARFLPLAEGPICSLGCTDMWKRDPVLPRVVTFDNFPAPFVVEAGSRVAVRLRFRPVGPTEMDAFALVSLCGVEVRQVKGPTFDAAERDRRR